MTLDRFLSLVGNGVFCLFMLLFALVALAWVADKIITYVSERGWIRVWRDVRETAKVLAVIVGVLAAVLALLAGIGWLVDHLLNFNVTDT